MRAVTGLHFIGHLQTAFSRSCFKEVTERAAYLQGHREEPQRAWLAFVSLRSVLHRKSPERYSDGNSKIGCNFLGAWVLFL